MTRIYGDDNWHLLVGGPRTEDGSPQIFPRRTRYGSPEAQAIGLVPIEDYPDRIIPKADWQSVIQECHAQQTFALYHQRASGVFSAGWNQDGLGYCWAYGLSAAVMDAREAEAQKPVRLAPTSLGWLVGWRNQGYYLDGAIEGARQRGIAPAEYVPDLSISPSRFKSGWEEAARLYRPLEWWDTRRQAGTEPFIGQCLAILRTGRPLYVAYNWWGHALECVALEWSSGGVVWVLRNSHGEDDVIRLQGTRGIPDEAYGVRAISQA